MTALESRIIQGLKGLPPERVVEVVDFVEFLAARGLTDAMARLDALGLPPITGDEIEKEIRKARLERGAA